ncbi:HlyD family secretion protein [Phenylobacterium sp.]|uniref:HlyD family secretion protein n=1 Tax=Phenylobacterium sp. TaxID=1871053 RepID=UPI0035AFAFE4
MTAALLDTAPRTAKPERRPLVARRTLVSVGAALAVAAAGAAWIGVPKGAVTTDDAYLQADSSTVAPKVRGLVAEVLVRHNQPVRRGQPLVRIAPEEFESRLASAEADLQDARAEELGARAAFETLAAERRLAAAGVDAVRTAIATADAQNTRAQADRDRFERLADRGFAPRRDLDRYRADAVAAASEAQRSRAQLRVSREELAAADARHPSLVAALAKAQARVARAEAALDLARQDLRHALVVSPIDGVVGDRQAEVGDYVQPGSRLMTVVPLRSLYVTANFKETQVARMTPGQPAKVKIDALHGRVLKGEVESFAPGSGSQFSLLPFEPGTGNFTKIVQRVPVRIRLLPGQAELAQLRPGLSSTVTVDLVRPEEER